MPDAPILYKKLEPILIAALTAQIASRAEIPALVDWLRPRCAAAICGDPILIFHGGAVKDGYLVEVAFPVTQPIETGAIHTRTLEAAPALVALHHGPHPTIRDTILRIYDYLDAHAWTTTLLRREVLLALDPLRPENNVTEVQVLLHEWERLLEEGTRAVLGEAACRALMQGAETIAPATTSAEYRAWIEAAMHRLDALTGDEEQKYRVVSPCAHVFPQERIDALRALYQADGLDAVLHEMYRDDFWYERPSRRGSVISMRKNPFNPEAYEKAATPAERRKAYCHCSFVHPYLDEIPSRLSPTFCNCGAGWYRRLWEGILGQPVRIQHLETLLKGNDQCTLAIYLPIEAEGECHPE